MIWVLLAIGVVAYLWWNTSKKSCSLQETPSPAPQPKPVDKSFEHTMNFMDVRLQKIRRKKTEADSWARKWGSAKLQEIDSLDGVEFEAYLQGLFTAMGYQVEGTPSTGDFGGDLILTKDGERTVVQAKRWQGTVGTDAVQEVLSGQAYYQCDHAWVVTNSSYSRKAKELAMSTRVLLVDRGALAKMIGKLQGGKKNDGCE